MQKCLDSYMKTRNVVYENNDLREDTDDLHIDKHLLKTCRSTGNLFFDNNLMSFYSLIYPLTIFLINRDGWLDDEHFAGCLDIFSICSSFYMWLYDGRKLNKNNYVPLANDISKAVEHLSIDEKIDYYLEHMAKYREEMIKENGSSLVNVLKARMEQLDSTNFAKEEPKGRASR